jgi:hypothetical protein
MIPPEGKNYFMYLIRILFIYSKLEDGWTITKIENSENKFEFKKLLDDGTESSMSLQ